MKRNNRPVRVKIKTESLKYGIPIEPLKGSSLIELRNNALVDRSIEWVQLSRCTAWYARYNDVYLLKSYNEIVAVFYPNDNDMFIFGRYSKTTYKHIRKFYTRCLEIIYPPIAMFNLGVDDYFAERN